MKTTAQENVEKRLELIHDDYAVRLVGAIRKLRRASTTPDNCDMNDVLEAMDGVCEALGELRAIERDAFNVITGYIKVEGIA